MVLLVPAVGSSRKPSNGCGNARRVELSFVVTVRGKIELLRSHPLLLQNKLDDSIDLGEARASSLVMKWPRVTQEDRHEACVNLGYNRLVAAQPADRSDRAGSPYESIGEAWLALAQSSRQFGQHDVA